MFTPNDKEMIRGQLDIQTDKVTNNYFLIFIFDDLYFVVKQILKYTLKIDTKLWEVHLLKKITIILHYINMDIT